MSLNGMEEIMRDGQDLDLVCQFSPILFQIDPRTTNLIYIYYRNFNKETKIK